MKYEIEFLEIKHDILTISLDVEIDAVPEDNETEITPATGNGSSYSGNWKDAT